MQGIAKGILYAMIGTICIILFTNFLYFFPWYMTMVIETFDVSQIVANDNYIKQTYYDDALARLKDRPIFRNDGAKVNISVTNANGQAIGNDDEKSYETYSDDSSKPYLQRGNQITVTISATYIVEMSLWGKEYAPLEIPASFTLKPIGLKHYKDLPYDF